jgi:hypothetical protein
VTISDKEVAELLKRRQAILNGEDDTDDGAEPICEAEDIGCECTEAGIESDWDWNKDQGVFICNSCGAVQ